MERFDVELCPRFNKAAVIIGRRWSGAVLRVLLDGATHFNEIARSIPGISDKMLSERLKEFEAEGLVNRVVQPTTPVRIEYRLTEMGEALRPVLDGLGAWARSWVDESQVDDAQVEQTQADKVQADEAQQVA